MKTYSFAKRYAWLIISITAGVLIFLCVVGIELHKHYSIYHLGPLSKTDVFQILSDAFFVPSLFLLSVSLIKFCKYVSITALLYSAFVFFRDLVTLGFIPRRSRKAYRAYRKAAKEYKGSGILVMFLTGFVFLTLALIFLALYYKV